MLVTDVNCALCFKQKKGCKTSQASLISVYVCGSSTICDTRRESIVYRVPFTSIVGALIRACSEFKRPPHAKMSIYYVFIVATSSIKSTPPMFDPQSKTPSD